MFNKEYFRPIRCFKQETDEYWNTYTYHVFLKDCLFNSFLRFERIYVNLRESRALQIEILVTSKHTKKMSGKAKHPTSLLLSAQYRVTSGQNYYPIDFCRLNIFICFCRPSTKNCSHYVLLCFPDRVICGLSRDQKDLFGKLGMACQPAESWTPPAGASDPKIWPQIRGHMPQELRSISPPHLTS